MLIGRLGRAYYSTGVTQDFLQSILARAQEATAKKSAPPKPRKVNVKRSAKANNAPNRRRNDQQKDFAKVSPRVKPTFNHSIVSRQPQFERKNAANAKAAVAGEELIDVFEETSKSDNSRSKARTPVVRRKSGRSREVAGLAKTARNTERAPASPAVKPRYVQEAYIPQEPTIPSLLKYSPALPSTPNSRLINYSLVLMRSADYPLYRLPNYGFKESSQDSPKSVTYSLETPYFGQYTGSVPLTFEREKLYKNLTVESEPAKFDSIVLGQYQELKPLQKGDFKPIAKQGSKVQELVRNADVVRKNLQKLDIDQDRRQTVYQVCSGLKPIAELTR